MTSCTECKNNGYCPLWKSEKVDLQIVCNVGWHIAHCTQLALQINRGKVLAKNCEKFQKFT